MWISIGAIVGSMVLLLALFSFEINSFLGLVAGRGLANMKIQDLGELKSRVLDMETGLRGYQLSRNRIFLEPHDQALAVYPKIIDRLRTRFGAEEGRIDQLEADIRLWVEYQSEFLALDPQTRRETLVEKELEAKARIDEIRALIDGMTQEIRDEREARTTEIVRSAELALGIGMVAGLTILALLVWSIRLQIRRLFDAYSKALTSVEQARRELEKANAGLEGRVAERTSELRAVNAELESFCYSVSHDLRAPLRGIDGFSLALLEDYSHNIDEGGREYLGFIRQGVQRMGALIDDLLQLSRISRAEVRQTEIPLRALVDEVIEDMRRSTNAKGVEFVVDLPHSLRVQGDPGLIRILLENLLSNAVKYSSTAHKPRIEIGWRRAEGDELEIFVKDNGVGFDMAYADKLFQPFQRLHTDQRFVGSGIGLATVKRIIMRHQGRIRAESTPGEGAAFFFSIPGTGGIHAEEQSDSVGRGQQAGRAADDPRP